MAKVIDSMLAFLANRVTFVMESKSASFTAAANTAVSDDLSISKAGYYPLGIVGVRLNGTGVSYMNVYHYYLNSASVGSGTVRYGLRNLGTASVTGTVYFYVLWQKQS